VSTVSEELVGESESREALDIDGAEDPGCDEDDEDDGGTGV
jgi:hypothetical protein